jgi:hypothetical protein
MSSRIITTIHPTIISRTPQNPVDATRHPVWSVDFPSFNYVYKYIVTCSQVQEIVFPSSTEAAGRGVTGGDDDAEDAEDAEEADGKGVVGVGGGDGVEEKEGDRDREGRQRAESRERVRSVARRGVRQGFTSDTILDR